jgi:hypothetical protein
MLSKLKFLWQSSSLFSTGASAYEVACRCGRVERGWRQRSHQVLRCRHCGASIFVLGLSPLPAVGKTSAATASAARRPGSARRRRLALRACSGALAVFVIVAALVSYFQSPPGNPALIADADSVRQQIGRGEKHLARGAFRQAATELAAARSAWQRQPQLLTPETGQQLEQLCHQADLLADLCSQTLEEIVRHADGTADAEWAFEFGQRYQGKAFCLDLEIRAEAGRHFAHPYRLWAQDTPAHLDLDNLNLLYPLPLNPAKRVVFLARLASVKREANRGWVVQFAPNSGVLLTDVGAARICCPALADADAQLMLKRQQIWAREWQSRQK